VALGTYVTLNPCCVGRGGRNQRGTKRLELNHRFDQVLVDRHKLRAFLVVDDDIGEADKEARVFVDRVRYTMPHGWDKEIPDVCTADGTYANANFLALGHDRLLPLNGLSLALPAKELLTLAQLLILVLAHFLSTLFQHARHVVSPRERGESKRLLLKMQART